jgi:hypothetical protein
MGLRGEEIQQLEEASQNLERLRDTVGQAQCLKDLAWSLSSSKQFDAAEEAASHAIDLLAGKGEEFWSANYIVFLETYIIPRARQRRPPTIWR